MAPPPSTAVTPMPRPCACGESCTANRPCHCCLAAEVEALRARNETLIATIQRQDSTFERQMEEHEELEALRAQVQRVRELRDRFRDHEKWASYRNVETLLTRALDGDA